MVKIFDNGFFQIQKKEKGGLVNGLPTPSQVIWGNKIPCHIVMNTNDQRGTYNDGKFTRTSFVIWTDREIPSPAPYIKLFYDLGRVLGEFQVQSIERFRLTGRTKITV